VDECCQVEGQLIYEQENASVSIGKRTFMNGTLIAAKSIRIGDDVLSKKMDPPGRLYSFMAVKK